MLKKNILPVCLATTICSALIYNFQTKLIIPFTIGLFIYISIMFVIFYGLSKVKIVGGILYTALLFLVTAITIWLMFFGGQRDMAFEVWFFNPGTSDVAGMRYTFSLFIGFTFFISSFIYYFTAIRYESVFVFLTCLIPCAFYGKNNVELPIVYIILIMFFYFGVMIHCRSLNEKNVRMVINKTYLTSVLAFVLLITLVASVFPKLKEAPLREEFNKATAQSLFSTQQLNNLYDFTHMSGFNIGNNSPSDTILFNVYATEPFYLRRQVFDTYSDKGWSALSTDRYTDGTSNWETEAEYITSKDLVFALNQAKSSNAGVFKNIGLTIPPYDDNEDDNRYAGIRALSATNSSAVLSAPFTTSVKFNSSDSGRTTYRTIKSEFFTSDRRTDIDSYNIQYINPEITIPFSKNITREQFEDLLDNAENVLSDKDSYEYNTIMAFRNDCAYADDYFDDSSQVYSFKDKVDALSGQITANCHSDYEKAKAIEQYFYNGEFKYDLNYVPKKPGAEEFLFNSKTGICSDFAGAMVLLCRSAGLPTRYVEGFAMSETDGNGIFIIREKNAHAFPEVFIPAKGWTVFEPTISMAVNNSQGRKNGNLVGLIILICTCVVVLGAGIIIIIFLPQIKESIFRGRLKKLDDRKYMSSLFKRMAYYFSKTSEIKANCFSADGLLKYSKEKYLLDITEFIEVFQNTEYGFKTITSQQRKKCFDIYLLVYDAVNEKKKK